MFLKEGEREFNWYKLKVSIQIKCFYVGIKHD